jgi:nitrate reductase cytochrome c-type subunit
MTRTLLQFCKECHVFLGDAQPLIHVP